MNISKGRVLFCPICGKAPKSKYADGYYIMRCKPLFREPHVVVMTEYWDDLVKAWNDAVEQIIEYEQKANEPKTEVKPKRLKDQVCGNDYCELR